MDSFTQKLDRVLRRQVIIFEEPHLYVAGDLPAELEFLRGDVDFCFENLGLSDGQKRALSDALFGVGLLIPGMPFRFRTGKDYTMVEPADGTETTTLPGNWKQAMYVVDGNDFSWIGKLVRPEQVGTVDYGRYVDVGDGYRLVR